MRFEVQEIEQMHQETRHRVSVECEAQHAFSCPCNLKMFMTSVPTQRTE